MTSDSTSPQIQARVTIPPPIPKETTDRGRTLARAGLWVGGALCCGPIVGIIASMIGMMSTFGSLGEGEDVAANAQRITDGVGLSLFATQIGWIAALAGVAIVVPSIIHLKKKR